MKAATRTPHPAAQGPTNLARPPGEGSATARALADAARAEALTGRRDWAEDAACGYASPYPPELFWPAGQGDDERILAAREVCRACPVRAHCLAYAEVAHEPTDLSNGGGIWGGLTGPEIVEQRGKGWQPGMPAPAIPVMTDDQAEEVKGSRWAAAYMTVLATRWQAAQQRKAS